MLVLDVLGGKLGLSVGLWPGKRPLVPFTSADSTRDTGSGLQEVELALLAAIGGYDPALLLPNDAEVLLLVAMGISPLVGVLELVVSLEGE